MDFYNLLQDLRIDSTDTLRRFGNQQSILERFLLKFLDDSTMLALKDAFSCRDKDEFESHAHTLKGIANNLGLYELGAICSKSVQAIREGNFPKALEIFPEIQDEYTRIIKILEDYKNNN